MATIETTIDFNLQLTVQTVIGEVTSDEIANAVKIYYEGVSTKFILWDFSRASLNKIAPDQVGKLAAMTKQYADRRSGGKTALVFSSDFGFGLGRVFDIHQEIVSPDLPHMTFRSKELALKWLLE